MIFSLWIWIGCKKIKNEIITTNETKVTCRMIVQYKMKLFWKLYLCIYLLVWMQKLGSDVVLWCTTFQYFVLVIIAHVYSETVSSHSNAVVTCEMKSFLHYFSLRRCSSEVILFRCVETCVKLFHNYFGWLLQLTNIFQHVQCGWNNFRTQFHRPE